MVTAKEAKTVPWLSSSPNEYACFTASSPTDANPTYNIYIYIINDTIYMYIAIQVPGGGKGSAGRRGEGGVYSIGEMDSFSCMAVVV